INSIEPSVFEAGTCYVAGTKYKTGDFAPYLYKTDDYGKSWKKITNGIAPEHFTRVLREDPKQKGLLYAGTETGMYISFNDGKNWQPFQLNLPIVPITDLALKGDNLIVATQGRSLWIIDDLGVVRQLAQAKGKDNFLFKPKDTYRMRGRSRKGSLTSGTNHPNGVITYFNVKNAGKKEVRLSYLNAKNDTIESFSTKNKKKNKLTVKEGANYHNWDTRGKDAERLEGMIFWAASTAAPQAVPGTYKVVLQVEGGAPQIQPFKILPDKNAETDVAGMQEQFDFVTHVNATVDRAHKAIKKIRAINKQLTAFQKQYKGNAQVEGLVEKTKKLGEQFSAIEKALYQTKNRSGQDPLNFPIKLTNKLAHLNRLVSMDDFPPTQQDITVKNMLTEQINAQLAKFDKLISEEIKAFNEAFNANNLKYLFIENGG
ncbi:MAG: WD40/YVTN/BNR-like repeat-containing protein, partial [Marinirhabdus sp.]